MRMANNSLAKIAAYESANRECARIIAADPAKYPPGSLPSIWAAMVLNPPLKQAAPATRRAA